MDLALFHAQILESYDYLTPFAVGLTKDMELAKDLMQETMYRALKNQEKYILGTNIKAWLFIIMRNTFINTYRKNKRFSKVSNSLGEEWYLNHSNQTASNSGLVKLNMHDLNEQINKLPFAIRQSFILHYQGYKYKEIAKALREPLGTIKSRIHFARKALVKTVK